MAQYLFENATLFDGVAPEIRDSSFVLVEGNRIMEVSDQPIDAAGAERIDCSGKTLMPGMMDCHVHIYAASFDISLMNAPGTWFAHYAAVFLRNILDCGFTTVRDIAGGDVGMRLAIEQGWVTGPRYIYGGRALSQTGGHGDVRRPSDHAHFETCACGQPAASSWIAHVVDGVDACLKATREELRKGASHIKIMGSGGVMSPSGQLENVQFSDEEIRTVVAECARQEKYVAAHCHSNLAIRRCTELGVRTIEHGTLIEADTARLIAQTGNYIVPTLAVIGALLQDGREMGLPEANLRKLRVLHERMITSLGHMNAAGCKLGFGTDLLARQHTRQGLEFTMRKEVFSPYEILHQATALSAELLRVEDQLGQIKAGYLADLLVVNGNPLENIELLAQNGSRLTHIMKDGVFHKRAA
ncbi:MAG: amidohydrolase family protein [Proteobacteria bacterium]|nr:amidohydrolase family protein [Pseudomonadota bacterium]